MEDYTDNIDDKTCICGKCRECELLIALYYEKAQPELLTMWVRKHEIRKRSARPPPRDRKPLAARHEPAALPEGVESSYELTLTTTEDDPYYLRESLTKIVQSAMFEIHSYEACIELTDAGLPHIHAVLYSKKKYLDATKIKSKFKYRYELKRVRSLPDYLNYIKKEAANPIISEYCTRKGIQQFWSNGN